MATVTQLHGWALFSLSQLARELGLDRRTVRERLDRAGVMPVAMRRGFAVFRLRDALRALMPPAVNDPEKLPPIQRRAHYAALRLVAELGESRRGLCRASDVRDELGAIASMIVSALAAVPIALEDVELTPRQLEAVRAHVDATRGKIERQVGA